MSYLLRSSAAWRALKDRWPESELHHIFLNKHPGYEVEELINSHHLITSATFITLKEGNPHIAKRHNTHYKVIRDQIPALDRQIKPDLIIDFESSGLRTTLLVRNAAKIGSAKTVGITQVPGRGLLYDMSVPSTFTFAKQRGFTLPMDYMNRDFVVLRARHKKRKSPN